MIAMLTPERRQAASAFSTSYMGFRWSEVQILSPRLRIGNKVVRPPAWPKKPKVAKFDLDHSENHVIAPESTLVFMATSEGRSKLVGFPKDP